MIRTLNHMEEALTISNDAFPLCVVSVLHLENGPQVETLNEALVHLQARHPLLRAGIVKEKGSYSFVKLNPPAPIELNVIRRSSEMTWHSVAEDVLNTTFDKSGPLMRCLYLTSEESENCELIICFHHAIMDGHSARLILHELLSLAAEIPIPDINTENAIRVLPSTYRKKRLLKNLVQWAGRQMTDEWNYRKKGIVSPIPAGSKNAILSFRLSADLSRRLSMAIGRKGYTLNSVLAAAILYATVKRKKMEQAHALARVITFLDLRTSLKPAVDEHNLGCFISTLRFTVPISSDQTIWQMADHVRSRIFMAGRQGEVFLMAWLSKYLIKLTLRMANTRLGVSALSFMGKLDLAPAYGSIRLTNVMAFITNNRYGPEIAAFGKLLHGRIGLDFTYLIAEMDAAQAKQIIDDVKVKLENLAEIA